MADKRSRPGAGPRSVGSVAKVGAQRIDASETGAPVIAAPRERTEQAATALANRAETLASSTALAVPEAAPIFPVVVDSAAPLAAPAAGPTADADAPSVAALAAPSLPPSEAGFDRARQALARPQAATDSFRQALAESASATGRGAVELNGKVLDALRAQSDAAFDLWRATVTAPSLSDAIRAQASGARKIYETSADQWKDVADAASRWFGASLQPMQSILRDPPR